MDENCPSACLSTPTHVSEVALLASLVKLELNQSGYEILVMALMCECLENQPDSFQYYFGKFGWTRFKLLPAAKDAMDRAKEWLFDELEVHSLPRLDFCGDRIFFRKTKPDWVYALIGQDFTRFLESKHPLAKGEEFWRVGTALKLAGCLH